MAMSALRLTPPSPHHAESDAASALIAALSLNAHPEGGYFAVTHVNPLRIPCPYDYYEQQLHTETRAASSQIFYLLTRRSPIGHFHRHKALTYHVHHRGRGRYILIHSDGRVEDFAVGPDVANGERLQWVVEGDVWKCSFLEDGEDSLLISEVRTGHTVLQRADKPGGGARFRL